MKQLLSIPLSSRTPLDYPDLEAACRRAGCDGIEGMWCGEALPFVPESVRCGYHLAYFPEWLSFWREDREALRREFGTDQTWQGFYGGDRRERLLDYYEQDMRRAAALDAEYMVFHVADVSTCEHFTYQWRRSHEEVIDAAAEVLNLVLPKVRPTATLLVENQWLPGFTFTEPRLTARLLDAIHWSNKGIMLDIGHLMNCNPDLITEAEGAKYVQRMLDAHGSLCEYIKGIHLHQSLSGSYVAQHVGPDKLPKDWPEDYYLRYSRACRHVMELDQHRPWHSTAIRRVLERLEPAYIVHELRNSSPREYLQLIHTQQSAAGLRRSAAVKY